jgi:hypothetical protein
MSIKRFKKAVGNMAIESFKEVGEGLQSYITEEKREYPNVTIRREGVGVTGKIAASPRDVVDSGKLRDSFNVTDESTNGKVRVKTSWDAPHAEIVYTGHGNVPSYPWVQLGLREVDWQKLFKRKWEEVQ